MIYVNLQGRLGNIMFQTAALEYIAKTFGYETQYPNIHKHIELLKGDSLYVPCPYADEYFKIFKNFSWLKNENKPYASNHFINIPFSYTHIRDVDDNTTFWGYFQSEEYWGGEKDFTEHLFEPSQFMIEQVGKYDTLFDYKMCSIHVRRGDYLKFPNVHQPVTVDYINKARELLKPHEIERFLVFSDDIKWCRDNLIGDEYIFIDGEKDYVEMFLMGQCDYKIVANSSFSWWGAYLSPLGGVVVAPKVWIADPKIDDSHVCPWYWERV